jgi:hypothetical protein
MESSIGLFSSTFAQIEDVDAEVDTILTLLGLFYALSVAPLWNKCKPPPNGLDNTNELLILRLQSGRRRLARKTKTGWRLPKTRPITL